MRWRLCYRAPMSVAVRAAARLRQLLDSLAEVKAPEHVLGGVQLDRGAADGAEKFAVDLLPFSIEKGAADCLQRVRHDIPEQGEHCANARMPAQQLECEVVVEHETATVEILLDRRPAGIDARGPQGQRVGDVTAVRLSFIRLTIANARSLSGTRCSRLAFMRSGGSVQTFASRSICDHRAPSTSPDRAAVRIANSRSPPICPGLVCRLRCEATIALKPLTWPRNQEGSIVSALRASLHKAVSGAIIG